MRRVAVLVIVFGLLVVGCASEDVVATTTAPEVATSVVITTTTSAPTTTVPASTTTTSPFLVDQPAPRGVNPEARTSQDPTAANTTPATVLDDFVVAEDTALTALAWAGIYCVAEEAAGSPQPTASAFVITIYGDTEGMPALQTPLYSETFDISQVGETLVGSDASLGCGQVRSTWDFYDYTVTLTTPFPLQAAVTYWLAIVAVTPSYDVFWGWRGSLGGNRNSVQEFAGVFQTFEFDRVIRLLD